MKIGLITTLNTNIGDDFIREGICRVLTEIYKEQTIEFVCVNKHKPYTVYPSWHPVRLANFIKRWTGGAHLLRNTAEYLLYNISFSRFDSCDLIVQCGAPVFWPDCSYNEWAKPLWHDVVGRLCDKIPVLNLAAGSCYPWERQPTAIEKQADLQYMKSILGYCRLTTVRDRLAKFICDQLVDSTSLIPCTAFLAARGRKAQIADSGYILVNYMSGGGHFSWEQGIDNGIWALVVKTLISRLATRHKVAFICHDDHEVLLAKELASGLPVYFPRTPREYFECVSGAKFAICNRMHASVGMAGLGIPSIAVCTDTRLLMVSEIGLKTHYVKDINADLLEEEAEFTINSLADEQERLLALQENTWKKYISFIKEVLSRK